jgi:hypothetical protein
MSWHRIYQEEGYRTPVTRGSNQEDVDWVPEPLDPLRLKPSQPRCARTILRASIGTTSITLEPIVTIVPVLSRSCLAGPKLAGRPSNLCGRVSRQRLSVHA